MTNRATWGMVAMVLAATAALPAAARPVKPGEPAPRLELRDLDGRRFNLSEVAYPGTPRPRLPKSAVLLDFFRTDCPPCRAALPELVRLHNALKHRGLTVVMVALLEEIEGDQILRAFLARNPVPFQVVLDPYETAARKYILDGDSVALPSYVLIDADGVVRRVDRKLDPVAIERTVGEAGFKMAASEP